MIPEPVDDALVAWLDTFDTVAPSAVEGLYVVGSVALDDWTPHSDVDVVAVVADPSDAEVIDGIVAAHRRARDRVELAVDGVFVAWGDLVAPPMSVQRPWILEGKIHVDGEASEINPVTWFVLAEHGIVRRGPDSATIGVHVDDVERRLWVRENLDTYWRGVAERLAGALADDGRVEGFDGAVLEWVVLGVARMLYTYETGDVASKSTAGVWLAGRGPDFAPLAEAAVARRREPGPVTREQLLEAVELVEQVAELVVTP